EGVRVDLGGSPRRGDLPLGVVGDGGLAEADGGGVLLVGTHEVGEQPGGATDAEHEDAGGHGVERAGMSDLAGAGETPDPTDDVVAGPAGRLVDDEQAVGRVGGTGGGSTIGHTGTLAVRGARARTGDGEASSRWEVGCRWRGPAGWRDSSGGGAAAGAQDELGGGDDEEHREEPRRPLGGAGPRQ